MEAASNSNLQTFSGWLVGDGALFGSNATGNGQFHLRASLFGNSLTYRVSYFIELAKSEKHNHYTIDALAQLSGFTSRHHFYRPFKKFHGGVPSDFLKSLGR